MYFTFIAVGFTNGCVKVLDAMNLTDECSELFRYARDAITHIKFSHDSQYLATAVSITYPVCKIKVAEHTSPCGSFAPYTCNVISYIF